MGRQTRYNFVQFNSSRYNGGQLTETLSTDLAVFNGFSLHNGTTIHIHAINDSGPTREFLGGSVPRGDGEFLNAEYWRKNVVTLQGTLTETTATLMEAAMDTIKKNLRVPEANLDLTRNSVVRRYKASLMNMNTLFPNREHYHTSWIPFEAQFECRTPFAQDRAYSNVVEAITTLTHNLTTATNAGTIEAQPVILFVVDAANSATAINIKQLDAAGATIFEIEYDDAIAAGDVLEFDSEAKTVKKNGIEVDYTGSFPFLGVSGNNLTITTTATTIDMLCTLKWKNLYL